jgi:hypothetical protein
MIKLQTAVVSLAFVVCAALSGMWAVQPCFAAEKPVAAVYTADETKTFKELTKATIDAIDANKDKEMVAKITDLETAWDAKEETLKPKDPATWAFLDKTLDQAISAIRGSNVDLKKGRAALDSLLKNFDDATKK